MRITKGHRLWSLFAAGAIFAGLGLLQQPAWGAEATWYELQAGSRLELADGSGVELSGRLALLGCSEHSAGSDQARRVLTFYAVRFQSTPELLEAKVVDMKSGQIPLFGGPGVAVSAGPVMVAGSDGAVSTFQWFLQHRLEQDDGSQAQVFMRRLVLAGGGESRVSFDGAGNGCPSRISLSLAVKDSQVTYRPEPKTLPLGQQIVAATGKKSREETVGRVTLVASPIPGAAEKVQTREHLLSHADATEGPAARRDAVRAMTAIKPARPKAPAQEQ